MRAKLLIGALGTSLIFSNASADPVAEPSDLMRPGIGKWCYDPVGPLSQTVRSDYVNFAVEQAKAIQAKYNVPGAIIAGMSIQESGYGRTRLSILSNNVLSFKKPTDVNWVFGRPTFVLWCQPLNDQGNGYLLFGSKAAAFDYVAKVFSERTALPYFAATKDYQAQVAAGVSRQDAGITWLKRIAPTYTADATYVDNILRYAKNPVGTGVAQPGDSLWLRIP